MFSLGNKYFLVKLYIYLNNAITLGANGVISVISIDIMRGLKNNIAELLFFQRQISKNIRWLRGYITTVRTNASLKIERFA